MSIKIFQHDITTKTIVWVGIFLGFWGVFSPGSVAMLIACSFIFALIKLTPEDDYNFLCILFVSALFLRVCLLVIVFFSKTHIGFMGYRFGILFLDEYNYSSHGLRLVLLYKGIIKSLPSDFFYYGYNGYIYIIAVFHYLFGYSPLSVKFVNCLLGVLISVIIYFITKDIFNKPTAKLAACIVAFSPSLVIWSVTNLRDIPNIFLLCLIAFFMMKVINKIKIRYICAIAISLLSLQTIRGYMVPTITAIVLLFFWLSFRISFYKKAIFFIIVISIIATKKGNMFNKNILENKIKYMVSSNKGYIGDTGDSGGNIYIIYNDNIIVNGKVNYFEFSKSFVKGWFYFLGSPFPWMAKSKTEIFSLPIMALWYFLLPFTGLGMLIGLRYGGKKNLFILTMLFFLTTMYALVECNPGTVFRHRDIIMPFYFIFTSAGLMWVFYRKSFVSGQLVIS